MGNVLKKEAKAQAEERHAVLQQALLKILPIVNYLWFEEVTAELRKKGVSLPDTEVQAALEALLAGPRPKVKYKEGESRSGRLWKRI